LPILTSAPVWGDFPLGKEAHTHPVAFYQSRNVRKTTKIAHHSAPVQAKQPKYKKQSQRTIMQTRCNNSEKQE
jgi:hypothetical protein